MTDIATKIRDCQKQIADLKLARHEWATTKAKEYANHGDRMTPSHLKFLETMGCHYYSVETFFERAKKHLQPTGLRGFFLTQTADDRAVIKKLAAELELALIPILEKNAPQNSQIKELNERLRVLLIPATKPALKTPPRPAQVSRTVTQSPAYQRRETTYSDYASSSSSSSSDDGLITGIIIGNMMNQRDDTPTAPPTFESGNGGDFGGGGASGSWGDDLGASNFS